MLLISKKLFDAGRDIMISNFASCRGVRVLTNIDFIIQSLITNKHQALREATIVFEIVWLHHFTVGGREDVRPIFK